MMMKMIVTLMVTMMNMMVIADDFSTDKITTHKHEQKTILVILSDDPEREALQSNSRPSTRHPDH